MSIRPFRAEDLESITKVLYATEAFREEEIEVAVELMKIVLEEPGQKDYVMYSYVDDENVVRGYYCVGPTPMTAGTYDLYWIAVDPKVHGRGIGKQLITHCEEIVRQRGGSLILAETSSLPKYAATRTFYERCGYKAESRIRDYYAPGDDLVVYTKHI